MVAVNAFNSDGGYERVVIPMDVITALEAASGADGYYHILNQAETGSVCGAVKDDSLFSGHAHDILPRTEAEQQGLQPCDRCMTYSGNR